MIPKLTMAEMDRLALSVAVEHRSAEVDVIRTRWWDYRLSHPTQTTYEWAEHYKAACREWRIRFIDDRTRERFKAFDHEDIFKARDLTAVWLARQSADRMGIPYDVMMEFGLQRSLKREFRHLMRPNQFYGEEFEIDLKAYWDDLCKRQLRTSTHPFFKAENFKFHPFQLEYRDWLLAQVKSRQAPHHRLLARLYVEGAVDTDMIRGAFSDEEVGRVEHAVKLLLAT